MSLFPLFQWFEATAVGTAVRESLWLFPVIECVHLLALALLGGTVLVVDLRMLGLGLRAQPVAELAAKVHLWMAGSLAAMILTGVPLMLSEAVKCYYSPPFWYKMGFLVAASLFAVSIRRRVAAAEPASPVLQKLTAVVSLGLWFAVGFSGRWIAFY
ncbi:MAG: hypothetical protein FJW20_15275 [Acidimicrobiia bacterium]|nr:hypothetical protein [Acidimicrobiia bacterium]